MIFILTKRPASNWRFGEMALVSADTSAEIKNITLDSFVSRHFAKPPARYRQARTARTESDNSKMNDNEIN
jgi:hypothetical protein